MSAYLIDNPPARTQFRTRYDTPSGLIVVHTAESAPDTVADDTGAEGVAAFIRRRSDPGSYHTLCDSDSRIQLVPFALAAYGDGTGSNEFAIHISAATQAHRWPTLPKEWRDGCIEQMAQAASEAADWLEDVHGITVPAKRVTKAESDRKLPGFISHGERDPGRRTDPGASFPWDQFINRFTELREGDPMANYEQQLKDIATSQVETQRLAAKTLEELRAFRQGKAKNDKKVRQALAKIAREVKDDATRAQVEQVIDMIGEDE